MPLLQSLHVTLNCPLGVHADHFVNLSGVPNLHHVFIQNGHLSSDMVCKLSCLARLTSLICNYNFEEVEDHSFPKSLHPAAFTNLCTSTLTAKLKNLYPFFGDTYNLFPLTKLHIHLSQIVDPHLPLSSRASDITPFLALVASRCPILEEVDFDFFSYSSAYTDSPPAAHVIGFSAIQPLLSCPCITSFGISHEYSLSLTQLSLNLHPTQLNPSLLDLEVLHLLTTLCPNLR